MKNEKANEAMADSVHGGCIYHRNVHGVLGGSGMGYRRRQLGLL